MHVHEQKLHVTKGQRDIIDWVNGDVGCHDVIKVGFMNTEHDEGSRHPNRWPEGSVVV